MNHQGTIRIETNRLILRPFLLQDAEAAYRNWCSDDRVTRFLTWPTHPSVEVTRTVIGSWVAAQSEPTFYQWAIVPRDLDEPIGSISVVKMDEETGMLHVGYCIGHAYWHKGYTSEAFAAVIAYLIEQVGALRIEARHDPENPNSGAVMRKCGLQYEGTLRRADRNNRGIVDACMYALLAEDYYAAKREE